MMTQAEYKAALLSALDSCRDEITNNVSGAIQNLPEKAKGFDIGVHPDQDQEGFLTVMIHVVGPDLYVLNKAIQDFRLLFKIRHEETGMSFGLPMFEPYGEEVPVGDVQVDTVAEWFGAFWPSVDDLAFQKPVTVVGADGFGTSPQKKLN
ncbi:MAG: DUF6389 family protein [Pseudomonadota bacterium]